MSFPSYQQVFLRLLLLLSSLSATVAPTLAQIVPDNTLPSPSVVDSDGMHQRITGGTTVGNNLFHSFAEFSILTGETAFFDQAVAIENILSRVTGTEISEIDGILKANGNANLFLLNPNGIIFSDNAALDLGGVFVGSTATGIQFRDGTQFTTAPTTPPLLTVSVPVGLQMRQSNSIEVSGARLATPLGQGFVLLGGEVTLRGVELQAPGGQVVVGSVAGDGLVALDPNQNWQPDYAGVNGFGTLEITNSRINTRDQTDSLDSGDIHLQGKAMVVTGSALLTSVGNAAVGGGDIKINATETVALAGESVIFADTQGTGNAGRIEINTNDLTLDSSQITSDTLGMGQGGSIAINATETVSLAGESVIFADTQGTGKAGRIDINTNHLTLDNSKITADAFGVGQGGSIIINATETVTLARDSEILADAQGTGDAGEIIINTATLEMTTDSGIFSDTFAEGEGGSIEIRATDAVTLTEGSAIFADTRGTGNGGTITLDTGNLTLENSEIASDTFATGAGGEVNINATEAMVLLADSRVLANTLGTGDGGAIAIATPTLRVEGSTISSSAESSGHAGEIIIDAATLTLRGEGEIASDTFAAGDGGAISLNVTEQATLTEGSFILANTLAAGQGGDIFLTSPHIILNQGGISSSTNNDGDAGTVAIQTGRLQIIEGGIISNAFAAGNGGIVAIEATEAVALQPLGFILADTLGTGDGGIIFINTPSLSIENGAISASTLAAGTGGNIVINAPGQIDILGGFTASSPTIEVPNRGTFEIPATGAIRVSSEGTGDSGNLLITTHRLTLTDTAQINASSDGGRLTATDTAGAAGLLLLTAPEIILQNRASIEANTLGGQGDIELQTEDLRLFSQSQISTDAAGEVEGGNIAIATDTIVAFENSDITANATEGFGGTVIIDAEALFGIAFRPDGESPFTSDITATSEAGSQFSGEVEVLTPGVDPTDGLIELPDNVIDVTALVEQGCAVTRESYFLITGRGGVPASPSDIPRNHNVWVDLGEPIAPGGTAQFTPAASPTPSLPFVEAQGWTVGENGKVRLTATPGGATAQPVWQPQANCIDTAS